MPLNLKNLLLIESSEYELYYCRILPDRPLFWKANLKYYSNVDSSVAKAKCVVYVLPYPFLKIMGYFTIDTASTLETIHKRHQQIFAIFDSYSPPVSIFFLLSISKFGKFLNHSPLENTDVFLNGWSLVRTLNLLFFEEIENIFVGKLSIHEIFIIVEFNSRWAAYLWKL